MSNKYIKINNEEEYDLAIKYLHEQGYTKWEGSKIKSIDYYDILHEYHARYKGLPTGLHILFYPSTDDKQYMASDHNGGYEKFIIPKEVSLKDKLIKLFQDSTVAIKINSKEELKRYCKLMLTLGEFYWKSGANYEIDEPPGVIADINKKGFKLLAPYDGGNAYIRDNTKLIEFKELLNHI